MGGLFAKLTAHYGGRKDKPFSHIVVDEARPHHEYLAAAGDQP
jgi:hypothetical protein